MGETTTTTDVEGAAGIIDGTMWQLVETNLRAETRTYRMILPLITPDLMAPQIFNMP